MRRLFLLLMCCAASCVAPRAATPAPVAASISYLALGDSYTSGEGVAAASRWPVQLAALARQQGLGLQAPTFIARTGWTTAELQSAIAEADNRRTYGLVSLQIGVNNHYRGQTVALYRAEFQELLRTAVRFAGSQPGRVFVLSIPDWGQSPFAGRQGLDATRIGAEIDQFNAVAREECRRAGVAYIDITPLTRATVTASAFARDGLHYAGPQLRLWAGQALPTVQALLKQGAQQ
jgi:hypothetical protein